jgi:hypothetical protein
MNGRHWSDYSEAELAAIRRNGTVHASLPARGLVSVATVPAGPPTAREGPAYPPEWLPEVQARSAVRVTQTPAEWMRENPTTHRNGTAPPEDPPAETYPAEWLQGLHLPNVVLGGDGRIRRAA